MNDHAINNIKHVILYAVEKTGIEAAEKRFLSGQNPLSPKGRTIRRVFAMLHQDERGNWFFPEKKARSLNFIL